MSEKEYYNTWDSYFINLANEVSKKSYDPSSKTGVVLVGEDNEILSVGFNGFPRGVSDDEGRYNDRPTKYSYVVHAETNSIYNAARQGIKLKGARMYTNFGSQVCENCAKAIIQAGISKIISEKQNKDFADGRWNKSIEIANIMLNESNVKLIEINNEKL